MSRPPIHVMPYADSGAGKSTFAATFPKPMLVFMFDPRGKEWPYLRRGIVKEDGHVYSKKNPDQLLIQIERYLDDDFRHPDAYSRFMDRLSTFVEEYGKWASVVLDSVTFAALAARMWHKYDLNKTAKDGRQWFGGATDLIEELLMGRFAALPMNVVVCAHTEEEKDEVNGSFVRTPLVPGKRLNKAVLAAFQEVYHLGVQRDEKGNVTHTLQTRSDQLWSASTQIQAPNGCEPDYAALWSNFDANL